MTKTCRYCGFTATKPGEILDTFTKDKSYKYLVGTKCNRCNALGSWKSIVGPYSLLADRPKPSRVCKCCGDEAWGMPEVVYKFNPKRSKPIPSAYSPICKKCEQVACLVLSEFTHAIRDGEEYVKDSPKYYQLLEDLYTVMGYVKVPLEDGHPKDVLQFPVRYSLPDGRPFARSAKRIWQIKVEAGYTILKEDEFE